MIQIELIGLAVFVLTVVFGAGVFYGRTLKLSQEISVLSEKIDKLNATVDTLKERILKLEASLNNIGGSK